MSSHENLKSSPIFKRLMEFPISIRGEQNKTVVNKLTGEKVKVQGVDGLAMRIAKGERRIDVTEYLLNRSASEPMLAQKYGASSQNVGLALDYLELARML